MVNGVAVKLRRSDQRSVRMGAGSATMPLGRPTTTVNAS
jgi:hypothetical protein